MGELQDKEVEERRKHLIEEILDMPYDSFTQLPKREQEKIIDDLKKEAEKAESILPNREEKKDRSYD